MGCRSQWAANEWRQGSITYEHADRICGFCSRNGITMPGYCLFWAVEESLPDWSLNEAGRRYEAPMDEWTNLYDDVTDANGHVTFRGFHGAYEITMTSPGAEATVRTIELEPASGAAHFTLRLD